MIRRFPFLVFLLAISASISGQRLDRVQGELLVRLNQDAFPSALTSARSNELPQLDFDRCLNDRMGIWVVRFDYKNNNGYKLLAKVRNHPAVSVAQFNHLVNYRQTIPNDPDFSEQWYLRNTGQSNGLIDADIDADEAWDQTTGGMTPGGKTIVIAVLDDGTNLSHPDLAANHWTNEQEIPDNNIDDDGNGFIDDFNGWSVSTLDDEVDGGSHGTNVAGLAAAVTDNNVGMASLNWQIKLMTVRDRDQSTEADVLAAYQYPLAMRRLYNETNGAKGAFVVATNTSWGIDNGQVSDTPLWCAFYDSLGAAGILNLAATTNLNNNIDQTGDIPSLCESDYLVAVSSTDRRDDPFGGFGPINVDVAAPGLGLYTTSQNGGYIYVNGTSFATPLVTSLVGLLYSVDCTALETLAEDDPGAAALLIKDYLMRGVDPIEDFDQRVSSGGRINANNSVELVLNECGACRDAFALRAEDIMEGSATLRWSGGEQVQQSNLRWRVVGQNAWITVNDVASPYNLEMLDVCAVIEWQIEIVCADGSRGFSDSDTFMTTGCCTDPTDLEVTAITRNSAIARWGGPDAADNYRLTYSISGSSDILEVIVSGLNFALPDLLPCTPYLVSVASLCDTRNSNPVFVEFTTLGCGSCRDEPYCDSRANTGGSEWIAEVAIDTFTNSSALDDGYGDYTDMSGPVLAPGQQVNVSVTPGFNGGAFPEVYVVWIDYNMDGDFDQDVEKVFESSVSETAVSGTFTVPDLEEGGSTRLRVSMKFDEAAGACERFSFGEVEDYCVELQADPVSTDDLSDLLNGFTVSPNPADRFLQIDLQQKSAEALQIRLLNTSGQQIRQFKTSERVIRQRWETQQLAAGIYLLEVRVQGRIGVAKIVVQHAR